MITTPPLENPFVLTDIFNIAARQHELPWQPFAEGVEVFWIYRDEPDGPAAALLKFAPGGVVPMHSHAGFEHIILLSGEQTDGRHRLKAGSLMIHQPGTSHGIVSKEGCIALAIYEKRVCFPESK